MANILELYKKTAKKQKDGDVMGVIRTLFPDITVETFMQKKHRAKGTTKL